jgi:O-antigen/teichoic acid export membrane protein
MRKGLVKKVISIVQFVAGPGVIRILSGSIVQQACLVLLSLSLPYLLSESDFGAIRVVTAYMMVIMMAGSFCLDPATASFISRSNNFEDKARYGAYGIYLSFCSSFLVGLIVVLITWRYDFFESKGIFYGLICRASVLFLSVLAMLNIRILQAFGRIKIVSYLSASIGIAKLFFVTPLAKVFGIWGWIIGMGSSDTLIFLLTMWFIRKFVRLHRPRWEEIKKLLAFARIQVISGIIAKVAGNLDVMVLEKTSATLVQLAHYGLAVMFFKNAALVATAFGVANFSRIGAVSRNHTDLKSLLTSVFARMCTLMLVVIVVFLTIVPAFIRTVYAEPYEESIPILRILCAGLMFLAIWILVSQVNIAVGKPSFEVLMSSTGLLFMILSFYIFLHRLNLGLKGAAWSLNICFISGAIVGTATLFRHLSKMKRINADSEIV